MKKTFKRILFSLSIFLILLSCSVGVEREVTSIIISSDSNNLQIGQSVVIRADIEPADATDKGLTWVVASGRDSVDIRNLDSDVIEIVAIQEGSVSLYAEASNGIRSNLLDLIISPQSVQKIQIKAEKNSIRIGEATKLVAEIQPSSVSSESIKWQVSEESIISIITNPDGSASIVGKGEGIAHVFAIAENNVYTYIPITVYSVPVSSLTLHTDSFSFRACEKIKLSCNWYPEDADGINLELIESEGGSGSIDFFWDEATPHEFVILGRMSGNVKLYAFDRTSGVKSNELEMIILPPVPESIQIAAETMELAVGEETELHASVLPAGAEYEKINWEIISGNDYITLSSNEGNTVVVKGIAYGDASVRAVSNELQTVINLKVMDKGYRIAEDGFWEIHSYSGLASFRDHVNEGNITVNARLVSDIVINDDEDSSSWTISSSKLVNWKPILNYSGIFDGQDHSIIGLYSADEKRSNNAFIVALQEGGVIRNVRIESGYVYGASNAGGIACFSDGTISGCVNYARIESDNRAAGIIVGSTKGTITDCINYGDVNSNSTAGGIACNVGNDSPGVTGCRNYGAITAHTSYNSYTYCGGIAAQAWSDVFEDCDNYGTISYFSSSDKKTGDTLIGGIIGSSTVEIISSCDNFGTISVNAVSDVYAGGIVGESDDSSIENCINEGKMNVVSSYEVYVGGIVGYGFNLSTINECRNIGGIYVASDDGYVGGIYGFSMVAFISQTVVSGCINEGIVTSEGDLFYTGGIGANGGGTISNCRNYGDISGEHTVAGIISNIYSGCDISLCENHGTIISEYIAGGIAGSLRETSISDCTNYGRISDGAYVAGIIGDYNVIKKANTVSGCVNKGPLSSAKESACIGGIIAKCYIYDILRIVDCHNTESIIGSKDSRIGGIVADCTGRDDTAVIEIVDCSNSGIIFGQGFSAGIICDYSGNYVYHCPVKISNCNNSGMISSDSVYGISAYYYPDLPAVIENCVNTGSLNGLFDAAGIGNYANISNCMNMADLSSSCNLSGIVCSGVVYRSGNVGKLEIKNPVDRITVGGVSIDAAVSESYNEGPIIVGEILDVWGNVVAGVVAGSYSGVTYSYNSGDIIIPSGPVCVGGVVGIISNGEDYYCCYNIGKIDAPDAGAFAGYNAGNNVNAAYSAYLQGSCNAAIGGGNIPVDEIIQAGKVEFENGTVLAILNSGPLSDAWVQKDSLYPVLSWTLDLRQ